MWLNVSVDLIPDGQMPRLAITINYCFLCSLICMENINWLPMSSVRHCQGTCVGSMSLFAGIVKGALMDLRFVILVEERERICDSLLLKLSLYIHRLLLCVAE